MADRMVAEFIGDVLDRFACAYQHLLGSVEFGFGEVLAWRYAVYFFEHFGELAAAQIQFIRCLAYGAVAGDQVLQLLFNEMGRVGFMNGRMQWFGGHRLLFYLQGQSENFLNDEQNVGLERDFLDRVQRQALFRHHGGHLACRRQTGLHFPFDVCDVCRQPGHFRHGSGEKMVFALAQRLTHGVIVHIEVYVEETKAILAFGRILHFMPDTRTNEQPISGPKPDLVMLQPKPGCSGLAIQDFIQVMVMSGISPTGRFSAEMAARNVQRVGHIRENHVSVHFVAPNGRVATDYITRVWAVKG